MEFVVSGGGHTGIKREIGAVEPCVATADVRVLWCRTSYTLPSLAGASPARDLRFAAACAAENPAAPVP